MVSIDLPMEVLGFIGLVIMALFAGCVYFGTYWLDMRQKNPELHVMTAARKPPFPKVVVMVDKSGRHMFFNGIKEKPQDAKFKEDAYGLKLDPALASKMPQSRLEDGTPILYYGVNFHFPTDPNGARAIVQLVKKIRKEYPQLNFIRDDIVLLELLTKSGEDLPNDVKVVKNMFPFEASAEQGTPQKPTAFGWLKGTKNPSENTDTTEAKEQTQLTEKELVNLIEEIKGQLKSWKIEPSSFSMKEGLDLLPIGTTGTDMQRIESITKIATQNDLSKDKPGWEDAAKFLAIIVGIVVVAYMVISAFRGN